MTLPKLEARVRKYLDQSDRPTKILAFAELMIADAFVIKGIRILKPINDAPFVVFPAEKGRGATADRWFDVAHPISPEARKAAVEAVLAAFAAESRQAADTPRE